MAASGVLNPERRLKVLSIKNYSNYNFWGILMAGGPIGPSSILSELYML